MKLHFIQFMRSVLIACLSMLPLRGHSETISFRADSWCPYVCNPNSARPGYMVEILKAIFEKQGLRVDVKITNWVRAIKETRSNQAQGLLGCNPSDTPDFVFPQKALGVVKNAYFTLKNSAWSYRGRESLQNKRIGVINGYSYGDSIDNMIKNRHRSFIPFSGKKPLQQILEALKKGELDGFVENPVALHYGLAELGVPVDTVKTVGWVADQDPFLYAAFSPQNPKSEQYAEMLNKGLTEMRRNGELRRILEKYNLEDWEKSSVSLGALDNFGARFLQSSLDFFDVFDARNL